MSKYPNDDLFEGTKMTFGEHLEELRVALWYAVIWLVGGVLIGLLVGDRIVLWIQTPLVAAIEKFQLNMALEDVQKQHGVTELPAELQTAIRANHVKPIPLLIDRAEFERIAALVQSMPRPGSPPGPDEPAAESRSRTTPAASPATPPTTPMPTTPMPASPAPGDESKQPAADDASAPPTSAPPAAAETSPAASPPKPIAAAYDPLMPAIPSTPQFIRLYTWEEIHVKVSALNPHESFMIYLQAAIVAGILLASPGIFWHIWDFVRSGLYPHEQNYVYTFLPISLGLFLGGAALAFFAVFPPVLDFLLGYNKAIEVDPDPRISEWIGFVLMLPIGFGLAFQLPLVMFFIERIGIISVETYLAQWRIAILVIVVLSAVLTPADPVSMALMAAPLVVLYFGGIGLCQWLPHFRKPFEETYEP